MKKGKRRITRARSKRKTTAAKGRTAPNPRKKWTVMVWIAGDNNLEDNGVQDIREMKKVGSTDDLNIVVQFDSMSDNHARRYYIRKGTSTAKDQLADLGATNTGDPAVATDFFTWAIQTYPAARYLAVVWNHGSGIDETDIYRGRSARTATGTVALAPRKSRRGADAVPTERVRAALQFGYRRSLFSTTLDAAFKSRAIAYDDTARDFLDNLELRAVLEGVKEAAGQKIDLVGFDACLMNVVELAHEMRDVADTIVGSEELEPVDGWPYDAVLAKLAADPDMDGRALGRVVVDEFVKSYTSETVTQSALDLRQSEKLRRAVDDLAGALIEAIADTTAYGAVARALNAAQSYDTPDFLDLYDLCAQLQSFVADNAVKTAAADVQQVLEGPNPYVVAEAHKGAKVARSHGVTIYYPRGRATLVYDRLAFAKSTRWDEFIVDFTGQPLPTLPPNVRVAEAGRPRRPRARG